MGTTGFCPNMINTFSSSTKSFSSFLFTLLKISGINKRHWFKLDHSPLQDGLLEQPCILPSVPAIYGAQYSSSDLHFVDNYKRQKFLSRWLHRAQPGLSQGWITMSWEVWGRTCAVVLTDDSKCRGFSHRTQSALTLPQNEILLQQCTLTDSHMPNGQDRTSDLGSNLNIAGDIKVVQHCTSRLWVCCFEYIRKDYPDKITLWKRHNFSNVFLLVYISM